MRQNQGGGHRNRTRDGKGRRDYKRQGPLGLVDWRPERGGVKRIRGYPACGGRNGKEQHGDQEMWLQVTQGWKLEYNGARSLRLREERISIQNSIPSQTVNHG